MIIRIWIGFGGDRTIILYNSEYSAIVDEFHDIYCELIKKSRSVGSGR